MKSAITTSKLKLPGEAAEKHQAEEEKLQKFH